MAGEVNAGTIAVHVKIDKSGLVTGMAESKTAFSKFAGELGVSSTQLAKSIGRDMMIAGGAMAAGLGIAVKQAAGFDQAMRNVNSIAKESEAQFKKTSASIMALVDDPMIRQGPTDLAKGLYDVVSSGFQGAKALEIMRVSAIGAGAGMTDTATATRVLTAVLNTGIKGFDTARGAMDILFREVDRGVNTFEGLANNIGDVLPNAKIMGLRLQEITAALALMTKQGVNVSEAQTKLNNLLIHVMKPGKDAQELMDQLGISYGTAAMQAGGLVGWLQQVLDKTHGNADQIIKLIPEIRGMTGQLLLLSNGLKDYRQELDFANKAQDGAGATMLAAQEQAKGAQAQYEKMRAELERLGVEIGNVLLPHLRSLVAGVREAVKWFGALSDPVKRNAIEVAAFGSIALVAGGFVIGLAAKVLELRNAFVAAGLAGSSLGKLLGGGSLLGLMLGTIGASKTGEDVARERALNRPPSPGELDKMLRDKQAEIRMLNEADPMFLNFRSNAGSGTSLKSGGAASASGGGDGKDARERIKEFAGDIAEGVRAGVDKIEDALDKAYEARKAIQRRLVEIAIAELDAQQRAWFAKENAFRRSMESFEAMLNKQFEDRLKAEVERQAEAALALKNLWGQTEAGENMGPTMRGGMPGLNEDALGILKSRITGMSAELKRLFEEAGRNARDIFVHAFEGILLGSKNIFGEILDEFKRLIAHIIAELAVSKLVDVFGGMLNKKGGGEGGGGGGSLLGGIGAEVGGPIGGAIGGIIGGILGFDNPINDRAAFRWGRDFGRIFSTGAIDGVKRVSPAMAGGGASHYVSINLGGTYHIREEADINKVADRLAWQMQQRGRVRV